jgi:hypothetical protein
MTESICKVECLIVSVVLFLFFSFELAAFGCDTFISGCQWLEIVKNRTIFDVPPKPNSYISFSF